jgi:Natural resistance-associated macrophage protein
MWSWPGTCWITIWCDVVSVFIIIATAAAIGGRGPLQSAQQAAKALAPVVGPAAPALFGIGLLGASLLAASVVPLSTSYAIADAVGRPRSVSASFREAPLFYGLFTLQIVVGAGVALTPGNLVSLVINAQVLNGIIHPLAADLHIDHGQPTVPPRERHQRQDLQGSRHCVGGRDRCAVNRRAHPDIGHYVKRRESWVRGGTASSQYTLLRW